MDNNAYDFEFNKIDGSGKVRLEYYQGKTIIIVNTASFCRFTSQYAELEELWQQYQDKGLIVIAVPTNNFANQEPRSNKEIADFCHINFNISFLITEKVDVISNNSHPFFNWTRKKFGWLSSPKWNFYKYIISKEGEPIAWFSSITSPTSTKLINLINQSLANANN